MRHLSMTNTTTEALGRQGKVSRRRGAVHAKNVAPLPERLEDHEEAVQHGGLPPPGDAGIQDLPQARVACQLKEVVRVVAIAEHVAHLSPIEGDLEVVDEVHPGLGVREHELVERLPRRRMPVRIRAGEAVHDGSDVQEDRLVARDRARSSAAEDRRAGLGRPGDGEATPGRRPVRGLAHEAQGVVVQREGAHRAERYSIP